LALVLKSGGHYGRSAGVIHQLFRGVGHCV
jgi:hypothetical protein